MSKQGNGKHGFGKKNNKHEPHIVSLYDHMKDGREYESLVELKSVKLEFGVELRRALADIEQIRGRKCICYAGNIAKPTVDASIVDKDDLPFKEMVGNVPDEEKCIDIFLVTNGGSGEQVTRFVDALRPRFESVDFLLPSKCMSAGTLWALSGDAIWMDERSVIGPIDPQIRNSDGGYVAAQSILTLLNKLQDDGQTALAAGKTIPWSTVLLLNKMDPHKLGMAINLTKYGLDWAAQYLETYKFRTWTTHGSSGAPVTPDEKAKRAKEIATALASNEKWKSHGHGITRDIAWSDPDLRLKINKTEELSGLTRALRRMWAITYYAFQGTPLTKVLISDNYGVFFHSAPLNGDK